MKVVKLKSKHYRDLEQLLRDAGAVVGTQAFPSDVYCSREDIKKMEKAIMKEFKKEYPYVRATKLKSSVAMHMLNLSPNESLADAIRPGYVLVDVETIAIASKQDKAG